MITTIYSRNKLEQSELIKSTLDNIYLKKTIKEITTNLEPRFTKKIYVSKAGDTYQSIINDLNIGKTENQKILRTILEEKSLKILRINQKFTFKFDNLSDEKINEFKIETDKKNEVIFKKVSNNNEFISKRIEKNYQKKLVSKRYMEK